VVLTCQTGVDAMNSQRLAVGFWLQPACVRLLVTGLLQNRGWLQNRTWTSGLCNDGAAARPMRTSSASASLKHRSVFAICSCSATPPKILVDVSSRQLPTLVLLESFAEGAGASALALVLVSTNRNLRHPRQYQTENRPSSYEVLSDSCLR
jgi:hypothetical protein